MTQGRQHQQCYENVYLPPALDDFVILSKILISREMELYTAHLRPSRSCSHVKINTLQQACYILPCCVPTAQTKLSMTHFIPVRDGMSHQLLGLFIAAGQHCFSLVFSSWFTNAEGLQGLIHVSGSCAEPYMHVLKLVAFRHSREHGCEYVLVSNIFCVAERLLGILQRLSALVLR